jgi:hypothetical protein
MKQKLKTVSKILGPITIALFILAMLKYCELDEKHNLDQALNGFLQTGILGQTTIIEVKYDDDAGVLFSDPSAQWVLKLDNPEFALDNLTKNLFLGDEIEVENMLRYMPELFNINIDTSDASVWIDGIQIGDHLCTDYSCEINILISGSYAFVHIFGI